MNISKCERCTERCHQAEMAHEIAKGRYFATRDLAKCAPYWDILFDENSNQRIPPDHLRELVQAEKDGRLVMLPCGVNVKLERNGHTFRADHWNHSLTAFRDAPETNSGMQVALFSIEEAEKAMKGGDNG